MLNRVLVIFLLFFASCGKLPKQQSAATKLFDKDNLVAWCIVPFDVKERGPEERAQMLEHLGISKVAYDWREKHVSEFEEEILAYKKHGLEYFAFWGEHPAAFALFAKYELKPQIWKMLPAPKGESQAEKVENAGRGLLPLVEKTAAMGCKLGIYNHGGWQGEPENMVAVVEWLRANTDAEHVGLVYNLHHGHEHIPHFQESLELMLPYLHCLNINGMNSTGDPKILSLGKGEHEEALLRVIEESGYGGPVGILGHRSEMDVEIALKENLEGLRVIQAKLN
jgi:hypothetical protein